MAPIKHHRDSAARNRDKAKKRKRPDEHANHLLYRCMGDLCGEECNQELQPVSGSQQRRNNDVDHSTRLNKQSMDLDEAAGASDPDDADYVDESSSRRRGGNPPGITKAAGRVNKSKKPSPAKQIKDMPVKLGLQKAERYLCNALDFGVQAGYLTPKDAKGRVLRVASGLLQSTTSGAVKRSNTDAMDARKMERRGGGGGGGAAGGPSSTNQTMKAVQRRKPSDLQDLMSQELCDNEATNGGGDVEESRRNSRKHGHGKSRSRSKRHGGTRKRPGKARSRSRSKRRHGAARKRSMGRSRSANPESNKQVTGGDGSEEQDDLGDTSQETTTSTSVNSRNDDDEKSVKSAKSSNSAANNSNSNNDSQTSGEEKKRGGGGDDDGDAASNDEEPSDDEDEPIKK